MLIYLLVCPFVFLAGFVDSIAGGGGLISLPAYMVAGLPAHTAIATNKLSSAMGTTISTIHYYKKGYMRWFLCLPAIATALIGSWFGAHLSLFLNESLLKVVMIVLLPLIAFYVFRSKSLDHSSEQSTSKWRLLLLCSLISLVVGAYDGLYGPGTGTFLMLLFTGLCKLSLHTAAGTTKAINLTTNLTSLSVFLTNGKVLIPLGLAAGVCNMLGNHLGSKCFTQKGTTFVKPIILMVLVLFFLKVSFEFLPMLFA